MLSFIDTKLRNKFTESNKFKRNRHVYTDVAYIHVHINTYNQIHKYNNHILVPLRFSLGAKVDIPKTCLQNISSRPLSNPPLPGPPSIPKFSPSLPVLFATKPVWFIVENQYTKHRTPGGWGRLRVWTTQRSRIDSTQSRVLHLHFPGRQEAPFPGSLYMDGRTDGSALGDVRWSCQFVKRLRDLIEPFASL